MTKQQLVKKNVMKLEGTKEPEADSCFLLSSAIVGASADRIHRWIGRGMFSRKQARKWALRLRKQGVWTKNHKLSVKWFEKDVGGIAFICDVLCMREMLQRGKARHG